MRTEFITRDIWPQLTKAVRGSSQRCAVAVAYFGKGASKLLPLAKGSRLVVDASERSVASGQTCPADLRILVKRGVRVYSVPNLHAKVFVLGRAAYIGSANVSNRSASQLVEAVVRTSESSAVRDALEFVSNLCLYRLTPTIIRRLAKHYRPPLIPGGKRGKKVAMQISSRPTLPPLLLVQLGLEEWSDKEQAIHDAGLIVARKRREHPRTFQEDSFIITGKCVYKRGDVLIQVTDEGGGNVLVSPPGNVLHTRTGREGKGKKTAVYVERPVRRRRSIKRLVRALGRGSKKALVRDGVVRDIAFAQALLKVLAK